MTIPSDEMVSFQTVNLAFLVQIEAWELMRIERQGEDVTKIILSKRNCLALLAMLSQPDSARTLIKESETDLNMYMVTIEDDHVHYKRPFAPGAMSESAENFIRKNT